LLQINVIIIEIIKKGLMPRAN